MRGVISRSGWRSEARPGGRRSVFYTHIYRCGRRCCRWRCRDACRSVMTRTGPAARRLAKSAYLILLLSHASPSRSQCEWSRGRSGIDKCGSSPSGRRAPRSIVGCSNPRSRMMMMPYGRTSCRRCGSDNHRSLSGYGSRWHLYGRRDRMPAG